MSDDSRRAPAAYALHGAPGAGAQEGEAEAVVSDEGLSVGPLTVAFLDADTLRAADYRIELDLWPGGRLVLTQLGRRFDTFARELEHARARARVVGLLAHGITQPETFPGAVLGSGPPRPAELLVWDTHVTVVPEDGDPWQVPLGAVTAVRTQDDPPAVVLESGATSTVLGQLARRRDAFHRSVSERWRGQAELLAGVAGQAGFADGLGVPRGRIGGFERLLERFSAPERTACAEALLAAATDEPRRGFVQLLDPDAEGPRPPEALPEHWAAFLLVPAGARTVLEILAGPGAATYVFGAGVEEVNRDLQALHFRRAPLALTPRQAEVTPANPHRLALRRLEPLLRLRAWTTARLIHDARWAAALAEALG
ncbi:MAG: hypothetical protein FIA95_14845 [Gemmatimonadetes bacterium]|nr:hypothetical protein [Gemmatimonadota bacterium]